MRILGVHVHVDRLEAAPGRGLGGAGLGLGTSHLLRVRLVVGGGREEIVRIENGRLDGDAVGCEEEVGHGRSRFVEVRDLVEPRRYRRVVLDQAPHVARDRHPGKPLLGFEAPARQRDIDETARVRDEHPDADLAVRFEGRELERGIRRERHLSCRATVERERDGERELPSPHERLLFDVDPAAPA
jgi:hypothetical protein